MNDGLIGENIQYSRGMERRSDTQNDTRKENTFKIFIMVKPSIRIP